MRTTNPLAAAMKHIGNPKVGELRFEGTVESVIKDIFRSILSETLYTRIDISIARDLSVAIKANRKKSEKEDLDEFMADDPELAAMLAAATDESDTESGAE